MDTVSQLPMHPKKALKVFEDNYSRWASNRAYQPTEIFKLGSLFNTTGLNIARTENFIHALNTILNDYQAKAALSKMASLVKNDYSLPKGRVTKAEYAAYIDAKLKNLPYFNESEHERHVAWSAPLISLQSKYAKSKLPLPEQIFEFYEACLSIYSFLAYLKSPTLKGE